MRIAALPAPAALEEVFQSAVRQLPRWLDHHGYDPLGLPPLRRAIAAWFDRRGLPTRPEQILVTNGAMHGLDLSIRAALPRGRRVLVEVPSYPVALRRAANTPSALLTPVPMTREGWDLDALRTVARSHRPGFAYLMPDFHNPTGVLVDEAARPRALRLLRSAGTVVVIDETFVELNLDGVEMPPPTASFGDERTVTVGSLSKAVWGGLRM